MSYQSDGHYVNERLSLKDQLCTIRYIGKVADKTGTWLGIEWDDPSRGKHNGTHQGVVYFECRSRSPTCASFIRPNQAWDAPRTFLQALREKYMPESLSSNSESVYFQGKKAEEIGFEKFHQRQAKLHGIHVLVLDHLQIRHRQSTESDESTIARICSDISELDLGGNLFESFEEICALCRLLPKLRVLTLDGNRFHVDEKPAIQRSFEGIKTLSLARTLIEYSVLSRILRICPYVNTLSLAGNECESGPDVDIPGSVAVLDLSDNSIVHLGYLSPMCRRVNGLQSLILKRNSIEHVSRDVGETAHITVKELDLSYNAISTFAFIDSITPACFPNLRHLRVTGNPLYSNLLSAEGKPLATEDGYMLTLARLPQLGYLNYSKITEKERLNAEMYYLSQIAIELGNAPEGQETQIVGKHPRFRELCDEYGKPNVQRRPQKNAIDSNSLAARLVNVTFTLADGFHLDIPERSWAEELPKSFSIYAVLGVVGKRLKQVPLDLGLILQTNERDPVASRDAYTAPGWWDSSDDEADIGLNCGWAKREVELVAGTRALATYVQRRTANVRVELKNDKG